jgi:hypothetical protein
MAYFEDGSDAMNRLEAMIDKVGTANVAYAVARICALKASHLEENWQDRATAEVWDKCGNAWDKFAQRCLTPR